MKKLQKSADQIFGEKSKTIISALLECIPYAGPFLSHIFESSKAAPVYTGNYSTLLEEALIPIFRQHRSPIYIFIDSAEQINENSYNLIANLAMSDNICIILATTNQNENFKIEFLSITRFEPAPYYFMHLKSIWLDYYAMHMDTRWIIKK